jgi:hypothetical protein
MKTTALRFEHIFRDADINRYKAVDMTRARDAFITAQKTDNSRAIECITTYEALLSTAVSKMHERTHRTTLEHQPSFEWNGHVSPCWYFEWTSLLSLKYHLLREQATYLFQEEKYQDAKTKLVDALQTSTRARDIISTKWLWRSPNMPTWCKVTWWDAQHAESNSMRAMSIYLHCEHIEDATMQQLYSAVSKAEEYATEAACAWPTEISLATIEHARVKKAWCKAHLLWEDEQYGAAIGLAKAWSKVTPNPLPGISPTEWDNIIHDWTHENNTVHYQKITTPATI